MKAQNIHICLVSENLLPNYMGSVFQGASHAILVVTERMVAEGERLTRALSHKGISVEVLHGTPSGGLGAWVEYAQRVAEQIATRFPGARVQLNVTGGTKLMAMSFVAGFQRSSLAGLDIIYVDTQRGFWEYLAPAGKAEAEIDRNLSVREYLSVQGFEPTDIHSERDNWIKRAHKRLELTAELVASIDHIGELVSQLNVQGAPIRNQPASGNHSLAQKPWALLEPNQEVTDTIQKLEDRHLLIRDGTKYLFANIQAARYLSGDWLEEYAYIAMQNAGLRNFGVNIHGTWTRNLSKKDGNVPNEFDGFAVWNNKPLLIDCKTVKFDPAAKKKDPMQKAQNFFNQADFLKRNACGDGELAILLSAFKVPSHFPQRAKLSKLLLLQGADIGSLQNHIERWMNQRKDSASLASN